MVAWHRSRLCRRTKRSRIKMQGDTQVLGESNDSLEPAFVAHASVSLGRHLTAVEAMADVQRRLLHRDLPDFEGVEC
jgi:hypothetical protein